MVSETTRHAKARELRSDNRDPCGPETDNFKPTQRSRCNS